MPTLADLRPGQRGRVLAVRGGDALVQRLMDLGVIEDTELEVVGFAPLGDPMEIRLGDSRLSLRRQEAAGIDVHPLSS
jgi:Fe2+ transport system protein FeoA